MQPSKPQPFRLPQRFDSPTLAKYAIPGEPTVIVRAVGVGSTAPFEYSDRNGRQAIFRYEREYDAHVLKVPASVWNHNKGFMAHELMDQRRLPHPLVVTVEVPDAQQLAKMAEALPKAASTIKEITKFHLLALNDEPHSGIGVEFTLNGEHFRKGFRTLGAIKREDILDLDRFIQRALGGDESPTPEGAETVSKSQDGQEAKSSGPYPEAASASLAPATIFEQPQEGTVYRVLTDSPEMDAPGNSAEASDVVVGQVSEQPGASATFSSVAEELNAAASQAVTQAIEESVNGNMPAPLYSRAWDMLESPMRLRELAAALETDAETLKTSIQDPLSTVELGHAGWVKRREPQA